MVTLSIGDIRSEVFDTEVYNLGIWDFWGFEMSQCESWAFGVEGGVAWNLGHGWGGLTALALWQNPKP